jgi:hypothetical protein
MASLLKISITLSDRTGFGQFSRPLYNVIESTWWMRLMRFKYSVQRLLPFG